MSYAFLSFLSHWSQLYHYIIALSLLVLIFAISMPLLRRDISFLFRWLIAITDISVLRLSQKRLSATCQVFIAIDAINRCWDSYAFTLIRFQPLSWLAELLSLAWLSRDRSQLSRCSWLYFAYAATLLTVIRHYRLILITLSFADI